MPIWCCCWKTAPALAELVALCGASPWISEQLAHNPVLLDELLDRASLYTAPDKELLRDELRQQVARLAVDDLEAQMDALRYFKAVARAAGRCQRAGRSPAADAGQRQIDLDRRGDTGTGTGRRLGRPDQ